MAYFVGGWAAGEAMDYLISYLPDNECNPLLSPQRWANAMTYAVGIGITHKGIKSGYNVWKGRGPKGLTGKDFESYLNKTLRGKGSFSNKGREFDGAYGVNNSIWYEAKSGRYWKDHAQPDTKGFDKFKSDVGSHLSIARQNGASFEVHSNTPIPPHVKIWLKSKNIPFKEH